MGVAVAVAVAAWKSNEFLVWTGQLDGEARAMPIRKQMKRVSYEGLSVLIAQLHNTNSPSADCRGCCAMLGASVLMDMLMNLSPDGCQR